MQDALLTAALDHMRQALDLLDQSGAAIDVSAHLDLAICRLHDKLGLPQPQPGGLPYGMSFEPPPGSELAAREPLSRS